MDYRTFFEEAASGGKRSVYLLHGEEEYVKDRAVEKFAASLSPDFLEFNLSIMDDPSPEEAVAAAEQLPVMDERRVVLIKNSRLLTDAKQAEEGEKGAEGALLGYLKNPNPTTVMVFLVRGKCDARKRLFKAAAEAGGEVAFNYLSETELLPWLMRFASSKGGKLGRREAAHLVAVAGRNLSTLTSELTKVLDYANGAPVTNDMLNACVTPDVEQNVFRVVDEFLAGNAKNAILILRSTIEKGGSGSEYGVLPAVASRIRTLSDNKRAGKRDAYSRMFSEKELDDALVVLSDLDFRMKSETVEAPLLIERALLGIFANKKEKED